MKGAPKGLEFGIGGASNQKVELQHFCIEWTPYLNQILQICCLMQPFDLRLP